MKDFKLIFLLLLAAVSNGFSAERTDRNRNVLYQVSTIDALLESVYDGILPCGRLKEHGDFGIGTFDRLEGEMVVLDGRIYQVKSDGKVYEAKDGALTPFATVAFFETDSTFTVTAAQSFAELTSRLDQQVRSKNLFYAIRMDGNFSYVRTRSIPAQNKPYPKLAEAAKGQSVFEFKDTSGTILGFYAPAFVKGVNVPGYHLHFITADKKAGGHILELRIGPSLVRIDELPAFTMQLPTKGDFVNIDLTKDLQNDLERVEKGNHQQ